MNNKEKFVLGIALFISLFLNTYGIWGGIPTKERTNLVFSEAQIKGLSKIMKETREELYQRTKYFGSPLIGYKNCIYKIILDGTEYKFSKFSLAGSRSFLIRSCYPDEHQVLVVLGRMNPERLDFNPHYFLYGGIYIYLIGACIKIASLLKLFPLTGDITYYFLHPDVMGKFFVIGRCVGALVGVLAIYIIYLIGTLLYDKKTGLLAAIFLSIMPASVIYAHYLKPHVFNLPWFLLAFYYSCKILHEEKISNYLLGGFFAGISCGILLSFGTIFILILLAHSIKRISCNKKHPIFLCEKGIIFSFLLAIIGFIVVNPYLLVSLKEAIAEYRFLSGFFPFNLSFKNIILYATVTLPAALGWPLFCVILIGILYALFKKEKEGILLILFTFPLCFYLISITTFIHYGIWILPFFIILSSRLLGIGLKGGKIRRYITKSIILFVFLYTFSYSFAYDRIFKGRDIKTEAGKWIAENIEEGSSVGFYRPLTPYAHPPINILKYNVSWIKGNNKISSLPQYFVESEYDCISQEFKLFLNSHYSSIKRFDKFPEVFGIKFYYGSSKCFWWWKTPNPTIIIYKKNH